MASSTVDSVKQAGAELNDALASLETALLTPVVSGELESWAKTVEEAAAALAKQLPEFYKSVLHPQYAQIAKTDAELLTRVEQLIAEDQNVLLEQDAFQSRTKDFANKASQIKKDEGQIAADRAKLEQEGIDLVLRIKRQRAAADTWLGEANYRDRGPVD
jgi:hypothetical protein